VAKAVEAAIDLMRPKVRDVRDVTLREFQQVQGGKRDK
jgi:hypothetical protein